MGVKAILLARVSDADRGQDPETQLQALRATSGRKAWDVAQEVSLCLSAWDEGQAKEVWDTVVTVLNETGADVLAVWAVDRLARGGIEDVLRKVRHLEHLGVSLYSAQEPFLSTTDKHTRELVLALLAWMARQESQRRSDRLRAKAESRRREAERKGQRAKWGRGKMATRVDADAIVALKSSGQTVREIRDETGFSLGTISNILRGKHPAVADESGEEVRA